jgi:hypothetical protein
MTNSKSTRWAVFTAVLLLARPAAAQNPPGIHEPGLILYGQVRNTTAGGALLTYGTLQWQIQPQDGSAMIAVTTSLTNINDQFSYVVRVPFQSILSGFTLTLNNLQLKSSSPGYTRAAAVVIPSYFIPATILPPASSSFDFSIADRGRIERVDLQVAVPFVDSDANGLDDNWEMTYFSHLGVDPKGDPDHDGMSNLAEYKAGTNPNDPQSRFAFISIGPDPAGGVSVQWSSVALHKYTVQRSGDLRSGFANVQTNIDATPGTNYFRDVNATNRVPYFYRIRAE